MTDNEIIKALECWTKLGCKGCPFLEQGCFDCGYIPTDVSNEILDLITRQKAEIERLNSISEICGDCHRQYAEKIEKAKFEAIKEFAERFLKELSKFDMSSVGLPDYDRGYNDCITAVEDTIDSLVK